MQSAARRLWNRLPPGVRRRFAFLGGAPPARQYAREAMNRDIDAWFGARDVRTLDCVEVSGTVREDLGWRSYTSLAYPDFDLLSSTPPAEFDVVICEQV